MKGELYRVIKSIEINDLSDSDDNDKGENSKLHFIEKTEEMLKK